MPASVIDIPLANLTLAALPSVWVIYILAKWSLAAKNATYAIFRMLAQLLLVGYVLSYIFTAEGSWMVVSVLSVMVLASSWIALGVIKDKRRQLYSSALFAISIGGGMMFAIIIIGVLQVDPWYTPQFAIPIAGMIFANSMNSISLAAERLAVEVDRGQDYMSAKITAFQTSLIPVINSLFAVGLVSLPGMMTGQILSGVSPLVASRYQMMVMLMIFASSGISTYLFLNRSERLFNR